MIEFRAEHFSLDFENEKKWYQAVTDFNMHIDAGEMVALIGESGCGKSGNRIVELFYCAYYQFAVRFEKNMPLLTKKYEG